MSEFETYLYTGNGTTQTTITTGFMPEFVWFKSATAVNFYEYFKYMKYGNSTGTNNFEVRHPDKVANLKSKHPEYFI